MEKEICNECGRSVSVGTGLYVNRVIDFNTYEERIEMLKPFPEGEFICSDCIETIEEKFDVGNKRITN
jgi:hypothetical protein